MVLIRSLFFVLASVFFSLCLYCSFVHKTLLTWYVSPPMRHTFHGNMGNLAIYRDCTEHNGSLSHRFWNKSAVLMSCQAFHVSIPASFLVDCMWGTVFPITRFVCWNCNEICVLSDYSWFLIVRFYLGPGGEGLLCEHCSWSNEELLFWAARPSGALQHAGGAGGGL